MTGCVRNDVSNVRDRIKSYKYRMTRIRTGFEEIPSIVDIRRLIGYNVRDLFWSEGSENGSRRVIGIKIESNDSSFQSVILHAPWYHHGGPPRSEKPRHNGGYIWEVKFVIPVIFSCVSRHEKLRHQQHCQEGTSTIKSCKCVDRLSSVQ